MQCVRWGKSPDKKVSRSQPVMPDLMILKQISLCCVIDVQVFINLEIILTLGTLDAVQI